MYLLLLHDTMEIAGCSNSYEFLCDKATAIKGDPTYSIAPATSIFLGFNAFSLVVAYENLAGVKWRGTIEQNSLRTACEELVSVLKPKGNAPEKIKTPEESPYSKEKIITRQDRPKAGTLTGRVWDIADSLYKPTSLVISDLRKQVLANCEAEGINAATAQVQFGKWKSSTL